uniref:Uncharacterized protein n=1 Tax=Cajanus cajan TaxID=3821 RepID=A0A151QVY1_CAJCA|nr:hypothetical protein KK1_044695 [Cajanus cajan]
MGDRKGDVRIYLISGFFLACTIGGGVFLCMYIIHGDSKFVNFYLIAGMTLVAIPWLSWFLIYLYRCFKPMDGQFDQNHGKVAATPTCALTNVVTSPCEENSTVHFSNGGGNNHVPSGAVVEMGNDAGQEHHYEEVAEKLPRGSKEEIAIPSLVMVESIKNERTPLKS